MFNNLNVKKKKNQLFYTKLYKKHFKYVFKNMYLEQILKKLFSRKNLPF